MEVSPANNCTLYLMLVICVILLSLDSYELYRISISWSMIDKFDQNLFETCIKKELVIKTIFSILSFSAALCASLLTLFLSINSEYFLEKIMSSYLNLVYTIFGPMLLGISLFGILNWNEVVFLCDRRDYTNQILSINNVFLILSVFIISLIVTVGVTIYGVVIIYIDSILRRESGNKFIRSFFWWVVLRTNPEILRPRDEGIREVNIQ